VSVVGRHTSGKVLPAQTETLSVSGRSVEVVGQPQREAVNSLWISRRHGQSAHEFSSIDGKPVGDLDNGL
jgi:hypothetical protein